MSLISIHALVKRATKCYDLCCGFDIISIHALVKRATIYFDCIANFNGHFNPRPREEGDYTVCAYIIIKINISIHALVKRATVRSVAFSSDIEISIHALVKRATLVIFAIQNLIKNFNPRPREEGDLQWQ